MGTIENYRKILLVYNPFSGNGMFASHLDHIIERCQKEGYEVLPIRGARSELVEAVFEEFQNSGIDKIIIAGGDGTINIVVNYMVKHNVNVPVSIFPSGTANDFAYYLELPSDINSMLDITFGGKYTYADVANCNGRCYINVAAMGNMVDVSQKTDPNLKNTLGVLAYYMKGASEITKLKPLKVKLTTPERVYDEEMYFMLVMNGCSAGGFKNVSPDSDISDGLLDVLLFRDMTFVEMLPLFIEVLKGSHQENRNVIHFKTNELLIESAEDIPTDVDGEHGERFPLKFTVLPRRLKVTTKENDI